MSRKELSRRVVCEPGVCHAIHMRKNFRAHSQTVENHKKDVECLLPHDAAPQKPPGRGRNGFTDEGYFPVLHNRSRKSMSSMIGISLNPLNCSKGNNWDCIPIWYGVSFHNVPFKASFSVTLSGSQREAFLIFPKMSNTASPPAEPEVYLNANYK